MVTNIPSLDTNLLLRLILQDQPQQIQRAKSLFKKHERFAVADQAIVEVIFALGGHYEYSRKAIAGVVQELMSNQHLVLNRPLFGYVLPYYTKHSGVSFTDCCLAGYAKLNGQTPLYTFDKKLARDLPYTEEV